MKIQNNFLRGTINKDVDERLVNPDELIDAENFLVSTTEGSNAGVGKNVPGNVKKTSYDIAGAKTIGAGEDENNNRIFNAIKGDDFDYIIEYNVETNTSEILLQSTTGGVLNFKTGERILNMDVISSGVIGEDLLAWSGDSNPPRIVNIAKAKTYPIDGFTDVEISVMKPSPIFAPSVSPIQITTEEYTFTKDKFISFAYRWKYEDNFYSAISGWSNYAFVPDQFNLNFDSWENTSMVNIANAIDVQFKTGNRDVIGIDVLMKKGQSSVVYQIAKFKKEDENWGDNETKTFQFNNSKIYTILPEDQYFRSFDNVPLTTISQTVAGNRLLYANFEEQRDIDTIIDLGVDIVSSGLTTDNFETSIVNKNYGITISNQADINENWDIADANNIFPVDFSTNTLRLNNSSGLVTGEIFVLQLWVTAINLPPFDVYTIYVLDETDSIVFIDFGTGPSEQFFQYNLMSIPAAAIKDYRVFIASDNPFEYTLKITEFIAGFLASRSVRGYNNICKSKSSPAIPNNFGDTLPSVASNIDFSSFEFKKDLTIVFSFDIRSYLEPTNQDTFSFFYVLEDNYTDLADFFANSGFVSNIPAYSLLFKNKFLLGSEPIVSESGFVITQTGDNLRIATPYYQLTTVEIEDLSPDDLEDKYSFFQVVDFNFGYGVNGYLTSLHSNRDYETGIVYMDTEGRKTTTLVSENNTIYIPPSKSTFQNKLKVTTNHTPPSWAKYYKFVIKQTKNEYNTIYANLFFEDGAYRWIKLDGENKNKVKDGDVLIVKADLSGPTQTLIETKVLDIKEQPANFISTNVDPSGGLIYEPSGLYVKVKPVGWNLNDANNTNLNFYGYDAKHNGPFTVTALPFLGYFNESFVFVPYPVTEGTFVSIIIYSDEFSNGGVNIFSKGYYASVDYSSFADFFNAQVVTDLEWLTFIGNFGSASFVNGNQLFSVTSNKGGYGISGNRQLSINIDIKKNNSLIFETRPVEDLASVFHESVETFTISDGLHDSGDSLNPNDHILNLTYNCFAFGNGAESNRIKDSFNADYFGIDNITSDVSEDEYKKIVRFADITYSGVYNSNTNVNKLNEFNLSKANYKDDIEKMYGPIMKIKGQDTDLDVYQEDKISKVFYGKDILFNADGSSNLSRIDDVLGQQKTDGGEYGISYHPDSFDEYAFNSYLTDTKRGVVLKKNYHNGLFEVSFQGLRNYFKKLFRDNKINHINGKYDQFHDYYLLNIQYNDTEYVTWVYSDKDNGWLGRLKFNPEDMIRINNHLISFKDGEVYLHNQESNYNTFYGVESPSTFAFNFSQNPSDRKTFKNISIEGTVPTDIILKTEHDNGYINKDDFAKKEGVFYAYVRNSNDDIDTSLLSCQGIGVATVNGLVLEFNLDLDTVISVGDEVRNVDLELVGTIVSKTAQTLVMNTVNNLATGEFCLVTKPQSIENQSLLGYYMQVDASFSSNKAEEIYALNSEISKSFE